MRTNHSQYIVCTPLAFVFPQIAIKNRMVAVVAVMVKLRKFHRPNLGNVIKGSHFFGEGFFSDAGFFFALAFSHLLFAALRASSLRSSGVSAFIRAFPPFGPPFLPPRFPISRMMRETTSSFTSIVYRDVGGEIRLFYLHARSDSSKRAYARSASSISLSEMFKTGSD
jgi:hypothetical protein